MVRAADLKGVGAYASHQEIRSNIRKAAGGDDFTVALACSAPTTSCVAQQEHPFLLSITICMGSITLDQRRGPGQCAAGHRSSLRLIAKRGRPARHAQLRRVAFPALTSGGYGRWQVLAHSSNSSVSSMRAMADEAPDPRPTMKPSATLASTKQNVTGQSLQERVTVRGTSFDRRNGQ